MLEPGLHAFWKYQRAFKIELVDRRVQAMEVAGQEILTRDKVSLRVNLTALWQVLDVVKARCTLEQLRRVRCTRSCSSLCARQSVPGRWMSCWVTRVCSIATSARSCAPRSRSMVWRSARWV